MKKTILILFLCLPFWSISQSEEKVKNWTITGYVKNLQTIYRFDVFGNINFAQDNLLHNRLNFKWFPNNNLTFKAELRNRIFYGERSFFLASFDQDDTNDFFDFSANLVDEKGLLWNTILDRFYFEYVKNDWEIRLGRQRINWGINTVWNPNDIYNAFNFTDFDYEERPGSDALRVTYYTGVASSIEVAVKAADDLDSLVAGALWKFNKGTYDFQILTGYMQNDFVLGAGWAGNLKNAGLKGELTWFIPLVNENEEGFAATFAIDYSFKKGLYLNGGFLYNSLGTTSGNAANIATFELSAKNLYPFKYAIFTQVSYPFTPLLSGGIANIYSPVESHALFINPTISYSIAQNWDLNIVAQILYSKNLEKYKSPLQAFFVRWKFSF